MESSFAKELYSESLRLSNAELGFQRKGCILILFFACICVQSVHVMKEEQMQMTFKNTEPKRNKGNLRSRRPLEYSRDMNKGWTFEPKRLPRVFWRESDLDREWQRRRDQFHTIGYRDGLIAGKEASAQEGFNVGFKQSVLVGYNWGAVRGVTSVLTFLPDDLKEKLIETQEKRKRKSGFV